MDTNALITIGVIVFGFAGQTLYFRGAFGERLNGYGKRLDACEERYENITENVRFTETCEAISGGIKDRLHNLESQKE